MSARFVTLRRICGDAVEAGVTPGLCVLVAAGGSDRFCEALGSRQIRPRRLPATRETVWDIASLTKPLVTTLLTMKLVQRGALALGEPVARRLPEFAGRGKAKVTLRQVLAHASGIPAHKPLWQAAATAPSPRWAIEHLAASEPLAYRPGTKSVYSDLGFIALGWLVERTAGARLDTQAAREIFAPLGLGATRFVNLAESGPRERLLASHEVAATERRPGRKRALLGEVDDQNASAMAGIAGHAGLFSTADEIGRIAAALVAAWRGVRPGTREAALGLDRDVVRAFWRPAGVPGSAWRLGWDGPAGRESLAGDRISRRAVGHLAFTGCSLWIDPERETWVVMLSNRIHPTVRGDPRFPALRRAVMDAALDAVGYRAGAAAR